MKSLLIINVDSTKDTIKWSGKTCDYDILFLWYRNYEIFPVKHGGQIEHKNIEETNNGKWKNIRLALLDSKYGNYDLYWFPDPDLEMSRKDRNRFLEYIYNSKLPVSQPSLTQDSFCSHEQLKNKGQGHRREFVEIMCPCFTRNAMIRNFSTFGYTYSGYGIDLIWYKRNETYVVDEYQIKHPRPVKFFREAQSLGFPDPYKELDMIKRKYL